MALSLEKETSIGVNATYHRIQYLAVNLDENLVYAQVDSYVDADARKAGKKAIERTTLNVSLEKVEDSDWRKQVYEGIKALEAWKDAKDA